MATTFYEGKVGASKAKTMITMMMRVIKMMIMNTNYYVLPGFMYLVNSSKLILLSLFVSIAPKRSTAIKFLDRLEAGGSLHPPSQLQQKMLHSPTPQQGVPTV